jgi:hypothetical protein
VRDVLSYPLSFPWRRGDARVVLFSYSKIAPLLSNSVKSLIKRGIMPMVCAVPEMLQTWPSIGRRMLGVSNLS